MAIRIALIVGHSKHDGGAYSPHLDSSEYPWNWDLAERTERHICGHNTCIFERTESIDQVARDVNRWGADVAISLHFNGVRNPAATGSEVLYWYRSESGQELAALLLKSISEALELPNRGLKPIKRGQRGWPILMGTAMPTALVEPFFGSNSNDARVAEERKEELAKAYAQAIEDYAEQSTPA